MSKKLKRLMVCGNYGIGNLGDEAILEGIIRLIESACPNSKIVVFSSNKKSTSKYFNLKAVDYFPAGIRSFFKFIFLGGFWQTIAEIWQADLIILGGGGLFADEKKTAVWIWFVQVCWFWIFRKKYFCLGQSVGPLNSALGKILTKAVFKRASKITVRDIQSKQLLKDLGVEKVEVLADPAYAIGYDFPSFHQRSDYVVITLRPWIKGNSQEILSNLAFFVDWLFEKYQLTSKFLAFQTEGESDFSCYEELKKFVKNKNALESIDQIKDYKQAMEIIARASFVVGMRLHSIIFAVLTKTPFLALSYSKKVKDFVQTLGMDNYLDYENLKLEDLKIQFEKIYQEKLTIEKKLEKQKLHFTYEVFKHEKLLKELLL